MKNPLNVITVKTGNRYTVDYVNKMESMLKRHLDIPFTFHCLTEDPEGLNKSIQVIKPPEVLHGWWNKLYLFSDLMPKGYLLYLDLDQVILGNITEIVQECLGHPFSCYSDHIEWQGEKLGTAFMVFKARSYTSVFDLFYPQRDELKDFPGGDQVWISKTGLIPKVFYFNEEFEKKTVQSYKFDVVPWGLHSNCKIINFHGLPKPHHVAKSKVVLENWR